MPLVANTNYTIGCLLLRSSNATTSGVRYNITLAGVPDWMTISGITPTTTTAMQVSTNQGAIKTLMPTAITASLAYPAQLPDRVDIFIDGNANTGGDAVFQFSGELANLRAVILRGSYCQVESFT